MAQSLHLDIQGPDWPLGLILVPTPGTPVNIMSLVDSTNIDDPATQTPANPNVGTSEYTVRAYGIIFMACKKGASHGLAINTGNIYIVRKPVGANTGNRDDYGDIVYALPPGAATGTLFPSWFLNAAPLNRNVFSPYRYLIDADNANDGCLVTLLIM